MKNGFLSIREADELFLIKSKCRIHTHTIDHADLQTWSRRLRHLKNELGELRNEDSWRRVISRLNWAHYNMLMAPLPFNSPAIISPQMKELLREQAHLCTMAYPSYAEALTSLVDDLFTLTSCTDNPMLDALHQLGGQVVLRQYWSGLVLRDTRMVKEVEKTISKNYSLDVLTATQLREKDTYQTLIFFGPIIAFPEYVRIAPRAYHLEQITYRWLNRRVVDPEGFTAQVQGQRQEIPAGSEQQQIETSTSTSDNEFSLNDYLPEKLQISMFVPRDAMNSGGRPFREGECSAQLIWLENGDGIFINATDGAKVTTIDIDGDNESIRRIPVTELAQGDYILIRTEGGGDLIQPVADRLMGMRAVQLRDCQSKWKSQLIAVLYEQYAGRLSSLCYALEHAGASRMAETKVRYWLTHDAIHPRDRMDFNAVMRIIKCESYADEWWSNMLEIESAHHQAGFRIRDILLQRVRASDLRDLKRLGTMIFDLGNQEDGGTLTAFRVSGIDQTEINISYSKIGRPLSIEEIEEAIKDSSVYAGV